MDSSHEYRTAYIFLKRFWQTYREDFSADLPNLLSDLNPSLWADRASGDPAARADWEALTAGTQGLAGLITFLRGYRALGESDARDITRVLEWIDALPNTARQWWQEAAGLIAEPN